MCRYVTYFVLCLCYYVFANDNDTTHKHPHSLTLRKSTPNNFIKVVWGGCWGVVSLGFVSLFSWMGVVCVVCGCRCVTCVRWCNMSLLMLFVSCVLFMSLTSMLGFANHIVTQPNARYNNI